MSHATRTRPHCLTAYAESESHAESAFDNRHIGPSDGDVEAMLKLIGVASVENLVGQCVPDDIRLRRPLNFGEGLSETQALQRLRQIACKNETFTSLIGMGYYGTVMPAVIQRNVLENPAWYTAYTPYQPEISQGRLEALLNFQTLISELTGLDIANASLLDEATACAEGMMLAYRVGGGSSNAFFVHETAHPQIINVLKTRAAALGLRIVCGPLTELDAEGHFGALFQYPGTYGDVTDLRSAIQTIHQQQGLAVVAADLLALTILVPPGEFGADVAVGSSQRFGVPQGYGGPHAAYIAATDRLKRELPGRLVGASVDAHGDLAYRLALQTREQHIRREKATSNICTAQVLLAVIASMYAVYHGPEGLKNIAGRIHQRTNALSAGIRRLGYELVNQTAFDTITVKVGAEQRAVIDRATAERINLRVVPAGDLKKATVGVSLDETTTDETVEAVWRAFGGTLRYADVAPNAPDLLPAAMRRTTPYLRQSVFHRYRSETELLRYLRRLSDQDLALDRGMIPLGSCTMKLNAAVEMMPVTWPEFSTLHPYAPSEQSHGYAELTQKLEAALCEITGYDAVSLQPNSGAQGEYAGLLAIHAYHAARGQGQRNVCLIPTSAHGTNPASARLAGMKVVPVACDEHGYIDLDDLVAKAREHAEVLAAAMLTYPSTHGVFEESIGAVCELIHHAGGQVYIDGANLNAQVGIARPADYGADVSHLNLHKTFCIPHGGGGPGVGPVCVKAHLAPYLPGDPLRAPERGLVGPVSAAVFGSAGVLPVSYMYLLLMGARGLRKASEVAIVSANYMAKRLEPHFPILYKNKRGRVAHECIIDARGLRRACGVTVDDIAKRLIDFGFHAPTMSFPVAGTFMIEPTESESKAEIDRFCDAMISIRREISDLEQHLHSIADSPLRRAPHTAADLLRETWERPYSRIAGGFPGDVEPRFKYWPPVGRVDQAHGDRSLVCACV